MIGVYQKPVTDKVSAILPVLDALSRVDPELDIYPSGTGNDKVSVFSVPINGVYAGLRLRDLRQYRTARDGGIKVYPINDTITLFNGTRGYSDSTESITVKYTPRLLFLSPKSKVELQVRIPPLENKETSIDPIDFVTLERTLSDIERSKLDLERSHESERLGRERYQQWVTERKGLFKRFEDLFLSLGYQRVKLSETS